MTKTKKTEIRGTKDETRLVSILEFRGKYLDSLLDAANKHLKLEGDAKLPTVAACLKEIDRRKAADIMNKWGISVRKHRNLHRKARLILRSFDPGYSMGELKIMCLEGKEFAKVSTCREYAKSSQYKAKHGYFVLDMKMHELRAAELIEGVWTVRLRGNKARWMEASGSKQHFRVKWVEGYLVGTSHGKTLEEATALDAGKAIRTEDGIALVNRFIGFDHRTWAHACEAGVMAFCQRHGLNPEMGYRIGYLLSLKDPTAEPYLMRIARIFGRKAITSRG